jgi:DNA-binding CsgD family transcriptional regulator
MTQQQLAAAKALMAAVTNSDSANAFCRNLVHTVLARFGANSAMICKISNAARLQTVGSYGVDFEVLDGALGSAFEASPISRAIKNLEAMVFYSLQGDMESLALAAGLSPKNGAVAMPLFTDGLVCGAVMVTFDDRLEENPMVPELAESLQVASVHFLQRDSHGLPSSNRRLAQTYDGVVPDHLTDRQLLILGMLEQPLTYSQIGRQLHVSESLVKQESGRVFRYLGVNTRRDAVQAAQDRSLLGKAENAA